jgi:hypothetical protein
MRIEFSWFLVAQSRYAISGGDAAEQFLEQRCVVADPLQGSVREYDIERIALFACPGGDIADSPANAGFRNGSGRLTVVITEAGPIDL